MPASWAILAMVGALGSELMQDEMLVETILKSVVNSVNVPVTLKMRTGWNHANKNAPTIAKIAQDAGIQMLSVHGRTKEDKYNGEAEYDTIAKVASQVCIPVIANGDINNAEQAKPCGFVAYLFGGAAHININNIGAKFYCFLCRNG
jgi:tRNA-dihydrouridine synthase